jgi:hypothetical protein
MERTRVLKAYAKMSSPVGVCMEGVLMSEETVVHSERKN